MCIRGYLVLFIFKLKYMGKKTKISDKLIKYLEKVGVGHNILEHRTVYTAIDAAATMKKKLNEIAKSLLIKADKDYYLVLVPADNNIDFEKLKKVIFKIKNNVFFIIRNLTQDAVFDVIEKGVK